MCYSVILHHVSFLQWTAISGCCFALSDSLKEIANSLITCISLVDFTFSVSETYMLMFICSVCMFKFNLANSELIQ